MDSSSKKDKISDRQYYLFGLKIIGDFGVSIAAPVVLFVILGQWLDGKYNKEPLFTIIGFILSAAISAKIIYKRAKIYGEKYNKMK